MEICMHFPSILAEVSVNWPLYTKKDGGIPNKDLGKHSGLVQRRRCVCTCDNNHLIIGVETLGCLSHRLFNQTCLSLGKWACVLGKAEQVCSHFNVFSSDQNRCAVGLLEFAVCAGWSGVCGLLWNIFFKLIVDQILPDNTKGGAG